MSKTIHSLFETFLNYPKTKGQNTLVARVLIIKGYEKLLHIYSRLAET